MGKTFSQGTHFLLLLVLGYTFTKLVQQRFGFDQSTLIPMSNTILMFLLKCLLGKVLHVLAIMRFVHYVLWQSQSESKYSPTYKYMNLLNAFDVITQTSNHKVKMNGILPSSSFIYGLFSAYPNQFGNWDKRRCRVSLII